MGGLLRKSDVAETRFVVAAEPTVALVEQGTKLARERGCDFVIAIGGGSVIDAGKAIAAMLANEGELLDYVEVIGRGRTLSHHSRPFIAIPTTAGTGAEVTRNAVLAAPEQRVKVSLRSALMLPTVALIDPELTYDLPPTLTASTGLDALTQLIEPFTCNRANPLTDAICGEGIRRVARSLRVAYRDGGNVSAREDMALAGLFGGLALANAGLGAAHGFAAPIGGMFNAPHGAVCAALLPHVMAANIRALQSRSNAGKSVSKVAGAPTPGPSQEGNKMAGAFCNAPLLAGEGGGFSASQKSATFPSNSAAEFVHRYDEVARIVTGKAAATATEGVDWVSDLVRELNIPKLGAYGIGSMHVPELVAKAANASSMKANPVTLPPDELSAILHAAL